MCPKMGRFFRAGELHLPCLTSDPWNPNVPSIVAIIYVSDGLLQPPIYHAGTHGFVPSIFGG